MAYSEQEQKLLEELKQAQGKLKHIEGALALAR
jgi:hypothetical protein